MTNTNKLTLDDVGMFAWDYGCYFFIETNKGNFVWSDPDYHGNNTIRSFKGNYKDWCKASHIPYARDKGQHVIRNYCGDEAKIVD